MNGIVHEIYPVDIPAGEPSFHAFSAARSPLPWERESDRDVCIGGGISRTRIEALLASCGEVVERYCSSFVPAGLPVRAYHEAGKKCPEMVDPARFNLFSDHQFSQPGFPFRPISGATPLRWVESWNLLRKQKSVIPACAVFLPYLFDDGIHLPASSSGLACGPSLEQAVWSAIFELIERDAFSVFWLNQLSPPRILLPDDGAFKELRQQLRVGDIEYQLLDLTTDLGVPVVAAFSFGETSFGYVAALGLGCHPSPRSAIRKALLECALGRLSVIHRRKAGEEKSFKTDFSDVLSFRDHSFLYSTDCRLRERIRFIEGSPATITPDRMPALEKTGRVLELLAHKGFSLFVNDLTTEDVRSIGLHVVRAVCPGLATLHGMHPFPYLRCERVWHPETVFPRASNAKPVSPEGFRKDFSPHLLG
jgi:ribosomal protein S12 methylthiotransferase accessory factor